MSKYLVTLTPVGKFFFGGDMTFSSGNEGEDEKYVSYIIHSSTMPQQTSLLGMMRFLILSNDENVFDYAQNHIKADKKEDADKLIGSRGFSVTNEHKAADFGVIKKLYPCFIYNIHEEKAYFKAAMTNELDVNFHSPVKAFYNREEIEVPELRMKNIIKNGEKVYYSGKDYLKPIFISADGSTISEEKLFIEDSRIGINKNMEGKSENEAFYKQIFYRMEEGFSFAFEVEVELETEKFLGFDGQLVKLGADASTFLLKIEKQTNEMQYPHHENEENKVVLLSDAYIPQDKMKKGGVRYAVTRIRPFRFLSTENLTNPIFYNVKYRAFRSKKRYDLYQAGSVFYVNNKKAFCDALDSIEEFRQIGYNKYY